jgi:isoamylase
MFEKVREIPSDEKTLGLHFQGNKAFFAIYSEHASQIFLGLFSGKQIKEFSLKRTGSIWHIALEGVPLGVDYAFRCDGPYGWLADPYAKITASPTQWCGEGEHQKAKVLPVPSFDWQGVLPPKIPPEDLVIYEMHVRGFTRHSSSGVAHPGTYLGVIEKIPYLKKLGVNAVELLPVFEWDETHSKTPGFCNYWGYNPIHFFAPMRRFAFSPAPEAPIQEFKTMVRELHRAGIEVILDVVYNHTGEGKELDYAVSFRGIDSQVYYMDKDHTGCGNTINTNHPMVSEWILESLRYWAEEMQVDGFRFDLASVFTRSKQTPSPLLQKIALDPVLNQRKLIAEPWDADGLYQVGSFPQWGPWSEWNGHYRDSVRRFLKGTDGYSGLFANALCGSQMLYASPLSSVNFITAHDGFCLMDLVTYQQKHNMANGENNQDGSDQNDNWNCGAEGPTDDLGIQELRKRQVRNFLFALFISQGIPMLLMGDERGHTRKGNNNPYVQDNELNWFLWNEQDEELFAFTAQLIALRKANPIFRTQRFFTDAEVAWHNSWDIASRFVSYTLVDRFFIAFNANYKPQKLIITEGKWRALLFTAQTTFNGELPPYSSILFEKTCLKK